MDTVLVMIARGWDNFLARPEGPVNVRFILQPALAAFLALRAGMKDAREGRPAFLWAGLTDSAHRSKLLRAGWKDLRTPFLISAVFDAIYQTIVHQAIYLFELLFTASLLVLVPYVILRGPVNRVTRRFVSGDNHRSQTNKPGQPQT